MPLVHGGFELHLGPVEQGGPDSLIDPIVNFINQARARQKLMIAVQEIDEQRIADAIVRARQRKVTVDVVIEQSYLLGKKAAVNPSQPGGPHEINRQLQNMMLRATVDLKCDFNPDIFHQKFMVLGNKVLTGSTNFTTTGVTKNLNHVVVVNDAEIANLYKREFKEIQQGRFGKQSIDRDEKPKDARVTGVRTKALFAPDHAPEMEVMKQILKAKQRIDFAVFTFAQSSGIDDALVAADKNGIAVRGLLDRRMGNQKWAAKDTLVAGGVDLRLIGNRNGLGKLHHKLMTIDDSITILGSFNYTKPANRSNDENILIIGDLNETNGAAKSKQMKIATAARKEIDRIRVDHG